MRKTLLRTWSRAAPGGAPCEGMTSRTKTTADGAGNFSARGAAQASPRFAASGAPSLVEDGGGRRLPTQCAQKSGRRWNEPTRPASETLSAAAARGSSGEA